MNQGNLNQNKDLSYQIIVFKNSDKAFQLDKTLGVKLKKYNLHCSVKKYKNKYRVVVSGFSSQRQAKSILSRYGYNKIIPYGNYNHKKRVKQKESLKEDRKSTTTKRITTQKPKVSKPKVTQTHNTNQKQTNQRKVQDNKRTTTVVAKPSRQNIKPSHTQQQSQIEKNLLSMCTPVIDRYNRSIKEKKDKRVISLAKQNRDKCLNRKKILESQ